MTEEKKSLYFFMVLGYTGLVLVGLAFMTYDNNTGRFLALFGYLLINTYIDFTEKKIGVTKKESALFKIPAVILLMILAITIYL
ncbi:hypothetical protein [Halobacillus sp. A5]|uniref:hypothetical protein n=1 Tax=Halobacillus sp. A5 TaxID=2880263 RepID=UPI0020A68C2F|nr:hypothetical protein [Halobacillus sp. A5]MCP3027091.1 hypothetical protein [Halobacillus sp. A5]